MRRIRCAIYTRKSSEQGLEQEFNSLDAQREACEAYIASQKHEGWELLPDNFDDGGISGGHLDRPGLQQLMQAVDDRRVDQIVVYKIDRMTRSLADFAKLVDRLDAAEASFVSVTQSFNTATSMGRLTLNVLLSFAQFEREVTAERIRDKIAASKCKGLWMGGNVPLGYQVEGRTPRIDDGEAATVRTLYDLYVEHGVLRLVKDRAEALGLRTRQRDRGAGRHAGGLPFERSHLHHILSNPVYAGRIRHKEKTYAGQHPAIIDPALWDRVQKLLREDVAKPRGAQSKATRSRLAGKLFDETGDRLTPSHSRKNGKRLRYYISQRLVSARRHQHPGAWRLPVEEIEALLEGVMKKHLARPDAIASLILRPKAVELMEMAAKLTALKARQDWLELVERVDITPGSLTLAMAPEEIARLFDCASNRINREGLILNIPFRMRRRGVELKLRLGDAAPAIDQTLVRKIVKARSWLASIIDGKTFAEIARAEGTSTRRIQQVIELAMLAPEVLDEIATGRQPGGLTTDYLIKTGFPALWSDQRRLFAAL